MKSIQFETIPSIEAAAMDTRLERFADPKTPLVLRGFANHWPAFTKWSSDYFQSEYGSTIVPTVADTADIGSRLEKEGIRFQTRSIGDILKDISVRGDALFVSALLSYFPDRLREDFKIPLAYEQASWHRAKIYMGAAGVRVPLHRDLPHNLNVQIVGRKRWVVFPMEQGPNLYPYSLLASKVPGNSPVNADAPDYDRFPRLRNALAQECVLEPGDALLLPSKYWHQTRTLDFSISLACWFAEGWLAALCKVSDLAKRVLGMGR